MPVPNDDNLYGLNVGEGIGMGLLDKYNINGDKYYDANSGKTYSIDSKGNLWGGVLNIERPEEEEYDEVEQDAMKSFSRTGDSRWDWKWKDKDGNMKDHKGLQMGLQTGLAVAGQVGDSLLNQSYKGNQGAYVSGAFGKNQALDDINNISTAISSTDYNDVVNQQKAITNQVNSQKTKKLSSGQIGGMAGVGAAKGASAGAAFGPYGMALGAVVGGAAGLGKGLMANRHISDANMALNDKATEINNYMNNAMNNIRLRNSRNQKQTAFNTFDYGGSLQDPYGINYFGNGKTHEQNKYGGVPVSIAEDGKPNLVEEGEVLYDDYVYSNRIRIPDTIRRKLKLKDSTKTFADAAKEVKERGDDRPNDPVTEHTIKAHMQILKSEQEKKKQQQEAKEQQKMMAQMNEQQLQAMQEQQMNQQANAYEQQIAQQVPQEQMAMQEQQPAMPYAEGGKLKGGSNDIDAHRFADKDEEPQGYDWDSFEINGDRYDFLNKGKNGKWDYGHQKGDVEVDPYYARTFKEGDDGFYDENEYSDYYNNALDWVKNLSDEDKEQFMGKYKDYYKDKFGKDFNGGFDDFVKLASDHKWGNNHMILSDLYDHYNPQEEVPEEEVPAQQVKNKTNWMEYAPLGIDAYLAARSFAPVDYSRANAIMNTPIRDIQYTPNGGKITPYIIDPRLQQMANYSNAQATNRAIQNNSGGNGANAVAAMLANNYMANQNAANIGFQADAQNAAQIQAAQQFNNAVDAQNSQGFLQAAAANQQADQVRGNFRADGLEMKDMLDSARGQAISNSMGALASDINNLNTYLYNKNWNAALAGSGYYGNLTPEGMRLAGITYQNTPQAQLDREAQIRMAQMQSDDNKRAIESQEAIVNAQLADAARQREWEEDYINRVNNQQ